MLQFPIVLTIEIKSALCFQAGSCRALQFRNGFNLTTMQLSSDFFCNKTLTAESKCDERPEYTLAAVLHFNMCDPVLPWRLSASVSGSDIIFISRRVV